MLCHMRPLPEDSVQLASLVLTLTLTLELKLSLFVHFPTWKAPIYILPLISNLLLIFVSSAFIVDVFLYLLRWIHFYILNLPLTHFLHQRRSHLPLSSSSQSLQETPLKVDFLAGINSLFADSHVDYLNHLRRRIVDGCAPVQRQTSHHLDSARFWKGAYDKAEEEKAVLLDKLYELKKQKAAATLLSSPTARSPLTRDGKRSKEDTLVAKANSRSKRWVKPSKTPQPPARDIFSGEHGELLLASEACVYTYGQRSSQSLTARRRRHEAPTGVLHFAYSLESRATYRLHGSSFGKAPWSHHRYHYEKCH